MAVATQVTDLTDLRTDLINRVREATGVTATNNIADRFINTALFDMHIGFGEKFPWAERSAVLRTHAQYTTGTVDVTLGNTTITGNSTLWNTATAFSGVNNMRVGGKFVAGGNEIYDITAIASDTSATLGTAYIGTTATAASYRYFEDEYDLDAAFLRPIDMRRFSSPSEIPLMPRDEFRRTYPRNSVVGRPVVATLIDAAFSGNVTPRRRVRFYRPPNIVYLIPYTFVTSNLAVTSSGTEQTQLTNTSDEPIVPLAYRHIIVLGALKNWYRDRKDDARSAEVDAEYNVLLARIVNDTDVGGRRPRIEPQRGAYRQRASRPWRGGGTRRYQTGTEFDDLRA